MASAKPTSARSFITDPSNLFVLQIVLVYAAWKLVHHFLSSPSTGALHTTWLSWVEAFGAFYAGIASGVLNIMGEETGHRGIDIIFFTGKRIYVQEHCLAIPAMVLFTCSIALFKGNWKDKLWFIPLGLVAVFFINVARLIFLSLSFQYMSKRFYDINHSYVYVAVTYALILLLMWWWMKKFSDKPAAKAAA